ncbi:RluA family pseudouridine synthase [Treponema pectinovorum]|uniref:RluA family pseudouridine synthase n=1 Tax=Treponema pectinovorum TaxID=164 RepID=UPI0011CB4E3A|nr:RluA family pseudouridine synthase [Treponema pectinovorum]
MTQYTLKCEEKIRLDSLLRLKLPSLLKTEISNSKLRRLIISGSIFVNGKQIRIPAFTVFKGSSVVAEIEEEKLFFEKQPDDIDFQLCEKDILFEDESIIAVNKPCHFPSEASMVLSRKNLHSAVVDYLFKRQKREKPLAKNPPYVGIMHRLDRDTSGAILFTKTRTVNKAFHDMFEQHLIHKEYVAVCCGIPKKENFIVEFTMGRISRKSEPAKWGFLEEEKGGLASKTEFTVLNSKGNFCVVKCKLFTGRTHQIRVHLSSVALSILGDVLYGGLFNERIMLHSKKLSFIHPLTSEKIEIQSPLPSEFEIYLLK